MKTKIDICHARSNTPPAWRSCIWRIQTVQNALSLPLAGLLVAPTFLIAFLRNYLMFQIKEETISKSAKLTAAIFTKSHNKHEARTFCKVSQRQFLVFCRKKFFHQLSTLSSSNKSHIGNPESKRPHIAIENSKLCKNSLKRCRTKDYKRKAPKALHLRSN